MKYRLCADFLISLASLSLEVYSLNASPPALETTRENEKLIIIMPKSNITNKSSNVLFFAQYLNSLKHIIDDTNFPIDLFSI